MKKALIVLSGGQDSTTCLFWAIKEGYSCSAITFNYNQLHSIEIESAKKICKIAGIVHHDIVDVGSIFNGNSPLTNFDKKLETHEKIENLAGLEIEFVYEWEIGSMLIFDRTNLHCSSSKIEGKKIGLTTFTKR